MMMIETALWYVALPLTAVHSVLYKVNANHADMPEVSGTCGLPVNALFFSLPPAA
jgi:hypothetical protein